MKDSIEKTTLGDMDVLSNLKTDMEATEKKTEEAEKTVKAEAAEHIENTSDEATKAE